MTKEERKMIIECDTIAKHEIENKIIQLQDKLEKIQKAMLKKQQILHELELEIKQMEEEENDIGNDK